MSDETDNQPIIEARGLRLSEGAETEAHGMKAGRDVPETEAHAMKFRGNVPETEAHASLRISFPPEADEHTLTIVYRPAETPGDEPEVVLHRRSLYSDIRLKHDIRPA